MHAFLRDKGIKWLLLLLLLLLAFYLIPYSQIDHMRMMPGDIGDARLVNYLLEHNHLYFNGNIDSLWHPRYFSPFPFALGFSDNLLGSYPIYEIARLWTTETDTAFQIWFLAAYPINYLAAYFALTRLRCTHLAASIGALIFAFSLPVTSHMGHPQLLYRFGLPLAIALYISFLTNKNWWHFLFAGFWLVWQYYCTIYIGFFTSLLLAIITAAFFIPYFNNFRKQRSKGSTGFIGQLRSMPVTSKLTVGFGLIFLLLAMIWLFYPYIKVSEIYGTKRSTAEIATMLPRIQSYFTAHASLIWKPVSQFYPEIPMHHEHQMFAGAIPLILAFFTLLSKKVRSSNPSYSLIFWSFIGAIALTLSIFGYSLWIPLTNLPLVSAIRAVTRLDLALLFPIAYFSALAVESSTKLAKPIFFTVLTALTVLLMGEMSATMPNVSAKAEWRERLSLKQKEVPEKLPENAILFFNQAPDLWNAEEIDSMWIALQKNVSTLNGYSGFSPPGYSIQFTNDCTELPKRVISFLKFSENENTPETYRSLMRRIVPIGFHNCSDYWFSSPPSHTKAHAYYSADQIRKLSISLVGKYYKNNQWVVTVELTNTGEQLLAADSSVQKPFRLMWRFVDSNDKPASRWQARRSLPYDLPPKGTLILDLPIDSRMAVKDGKLQVFLEQIAIRNIPPLSIPWD